MAVASNFNADNEVFYHITVLTHPTADRVQNYLPLYPRPPPDTRREGEGRS